METVPKLTLDIPDHTILDKIGEGGMSAVYLGRQISLQRKVAIKILKKLVMEDKSLAERFVNEAKTVASLDHPHIISIYEAKKLPSGLAYFTMPYLTHGDFSEIICTNSDHLIELLCQICDGLAHAHKHGIVHRDLKPDNILFDQFGRIKIADFGIAISKNTQRKTKETQLLGSAHYMSPEQIQSRDIDGKSDIYSLGCIIYEKLTGDHVFETGNDFSILMSHINKPVPPLPDVLSEWQPVIDRCLAKDPKDRFETVEKLKSALLVIKNSKQPAVVIEEPNTSFFSRIKPAYLGAAVGGLAVLLLAVLWVSNNEQKSVIESQPTNEQIQLAEQQATTAEAEAKKAQADALELKAGVTENNKSAEEELVDLTENLDNETINQISIEVKLSEAQDLLKRYRLTKPKGANAADMFEAILLEQPDNQAAQQGLNQVGSYYFSLIENKLADDEIPDAIEFVQSLADYFNDYAIDRSLFETEISAIMTSTHDLVSSAVISRRKNTQAEQYLQMASLLKPDYAFISDLKTNYNNIPKTGDVITDQLGHEFIYFAVKKDSSLQDFLLGTHEVTVEQFTRFAGEGLAEEKCNHYDKKLFFKKTWLKPPFDQTSQHPVVCITADNAQSYAHWLSSQTNHQYRLPTAAEFQYLDQQLKPISNCQQANLAGSEVAEENKATENRYSCNDQQVFTAPVKTYQSNNKLYNINGNVSEWVSACGSQSTCAIGNSWRSGKNLNNQMTLSLNPIETHSEVGFRLVREFD